MIVNNYNSTESDVSDIYEVCPESIGPTFIFPRHSVRATSAGHERQQ